MTVFNEITKYDVYNARMAKGMLDKLFFLDKVDAQVFVDFGCADGTLFKYMQPFVSDAKFIGYDADSKMCQQARNNHPNANTEFNNEWDDVVAGVRLYQANHNFKPKSCLILSSVIHEVYHYSTVKEIDEFWQRVFGANFDYIVIRDMIPSDTIDRISDMNDVAKVLRKYRDSRELKDFERRWGSIEGNKNLVHFLLKYKYTTPNWDREVRENYLPLYREDLLGMLPQNYGIVYHEHFPLPYLKREIKKDFGIELKDATHLKIVLEKA